MCPETGPRRQPALAALAGSPPGGSPVNVDLGAWEDSRADGPWDDTMDIEIAPPTLQLDYFDGLELRPYQIIAKGRQREGPQPEDQTPETRSEPRRCIYIYIYIHVWKRNKYIYIYI